MLLGAQGHGRVTAQRPARRHVGGTCRCRGEDGWRYGEHERIDGIDLVEHFGLTQQLDESRGEYRPCDQACRGHPRALSEELPEDVRSRGPERDSDTNLTPPLSNEILAESVNTGRRQYSSNKPECHEQFRCKRWTTCESRSGSQSQ